MTRLEVVNNILGVLRRSDCSQALALTFLDQGVRRLQRQLRVPSMERVMHEVAVSTMRSFTMPGDLLEIIDVVAGQLPLDKLSHRELMLRSLRDPRVAQPHCYSRFGSGVYLYPALPAAGEVFLSYYGNFSDLPDDASTNEATTEFPDLLTYSALTFAGLYFRHDQTDTWEAKFEELLTETQDQATQLDAKGGPETVQSAYGEC